MPLRVMVACCVARAALACVTPVANPGLVECLGDDSGEITVCDGVTSIPKFAFYYCRSLTKVTLPNSLTTVETYVFYACASLQEVNFGTGIETIGNYAFWGTALTGDVYLPVEEGSVDIGNVAFLFSVVVKYGDPPTMAPTPAPTACVTPVANPGCGLCPGADSGEITVCDGVTSIPLCAFYYCQSLTKVNFGTGIETIGEHAFASTALAGDVYLPVGTDVGADAFPSSVVVQYADTGTEALTTPASEAEHDSVSGAVLPDIVAALALALAATCALG